MEIVEERSALLSNHEVFELLKEVQNSPKALETPSRKQERLATIVYTTIKYLENTPCNNQNADNISELMKKLQPFNLKKAEKLQLLNLRPSTAVEIQLIIEESEERLTEEQIDELLEIIHQSLPVESDESNESALQIE